MMAVSWYFTRSRIFKTWSHISNYKLILCKPPAPAHFTHSHPRPCLWQPPICPLCPRASLFSFHTQVRLYVPVFLWLNVTEHNTLTVRPYRYKRRHFLPFYGWIIFHWIYHLPLLSQEKTTFILSLIPQTPPTRSFLQLPKEFTA